jgi:hypothetical protein
LPAEDGADAKKASISASFCCFLLADVIETLVLDPVFSSVFAVETFAGFAADCDTPLVALVY